MRVQDHSESVVDALHWSKIAHPLITIAHAAQCAVCSVLNMMRQGFIVLREPSWKRRVPEGQVSVALLHPDHQIPVL